MEDQQTTSNFRLSIGPLATFNPTKTTDGGSGSGSLRDAIFSANSNPGDDTIFLADGAVYTLSLPNPSIFDGENSNATGDLDITDITGSLTIIGQGNGATIDAQEIDRVFHVLSNASLILENVTVTGGSTTVFPLDEDGGAGIFGAANSSIVVSDSTISGNSAEFGGGGIHVTDSSLVVTNSTISGNSAEVGQGGGIYGGENSNVVVSNSNISGNSTSAGFGGGIGVGSSLLEVSNSSISGNSAVFGGGIFGGFDSLVEVSNSSISGNSADSGGGINVSNSNLVVSNSTISGNSGNLVTIGDGGGILADSSNVEVSNSTISGNSTRDTIFNASGIYSDTDSTIAVTSTIIAANANNRDVSGDFTSGGNNLIGNGEDFLGFTGFTNGVNGDIVGTPNNPIDPLLGPLQNNGSFLAGAPSSQVPLLTQALLDGSPALDAGSNPDNLVFDQRGTGFARVVGPRADIGPFEVQDAAPTTVFLAIGNDRTVEGGPLEFEVLVLDENGNNIPAPEPIQFRFVTRNLTAIKGLDYLDPELLRAVIRPGQLSTTIEVPTLLDTINEPNERMTLIGRAIVQGNAQWQDNRGTGVIRNLAFAGVQSDLITNPQADPFEGELIAPDAQEISFDSHLTEVMGGGAALNGLSYYDQEPTELAVQLESMLPEPSFI